MPPFGFWGLPDLIIDWCGLSVALCFVVARVAVRRIRRQTNLLISDIWLVISAIDLILVCTSDTMLYLHGGLQGNWNKTTAKAVFAGTLFREFGMYLPKFSILAFYYRLFPLAFSRTRIALHVITGYTAAAGISAIAIDTFWCGLDVSRNWSMTTDACYVFARPNLYIANWAVQFAADTLIFVLPFPLLRNLRTLQRLEKIGLALTFALGIVTMGVSLCRLSQVFWINPRHIPPSMSTEIATAIIVVTLPAFRPYPRAKSRQPLPSLPTVQVTKFDALEEKHVGAVMR